MKKHLSTIILVFVFFVGLSVLLYPMVSDFYNQKKQSKAIVNYEVLMEDLEPKDYTDYFKKAENYNKKVKDFQNSKISKNDLKGYNDILNLDGKGMIGYITIDKIKVELPIYHSVSDVVLNNAAGHLEGTSLPIGGKSTHCVLSAHRGLPSAKLFTNLDKLRENDIFTITVLDRVLTYRVDSVATVLPQEVSRISVEEGKDYCTLVTCTPYGINTHRLLVRGVRISDEENRNRFNIATDAFRIDPIIVTPLVAVPMLGVLLVVLLVKYFKKKRDH